MRAGDQPKTPRRLDEHSQREKAVGKNETAMARIGVRRRSVAWSAFCVVVLSAVVWSALHLLRSPDPNKLLEQAYAERRTIELRMDGAAYGSMQLERGPAQPHYKSPLPLLDAEIMLKNDGRKHAEEIIWLQAQARLSLLEWDYDHAIRQIDEALMLKPDDSGLLQDRAIAYFERAEKLGPAGAIDYGQAAEDLSKAMKKMNGANNVALFNRAIVFDRLCLPSQAIEDLEHFLLIEPSGPWAGEAKERLVRLQKLVKDHEDTLAKPLADPATFGQLAATREGAARLNERIEDYQDLAIREWLPSAFPLSQAGTDKAETLSALHALATLLKEKHQDHWLEDLLELSAAPGFASAVADLKAAVKESDAGDPIKAQSRAISAENLFSAAANKAGEIRSKLEKVHALQRLRHPDQCLLASRLAAETLHKSEYVWLDAQLKIEQSACSMMLEQFEQARLYNVAAAQRAQAGNYPILQLRALGISASIETDAGDVTSAWRKNIQGLNAYWQNTSASPMRGHQFCDDLMYSAEDLELWDLAVAFARESAEAISLTADRSAEALDRQHLATLAIRVGYLDMAETELSRANKMLASFHQDKTVTAYKVFGEIDRAQIELRRGLINEAEKRLREIESDLAGMSFEIPLSFYSVYGAVLQKQGKNEEARRAFLTAIRMTSSNPEFLADPSKRYAWMQELSKVYRALTEIEVNEGRAEESLMTWEAFRALSMASPSKAPLSERPAILCRRLSHDSTKTVLIYAVLPHGLATWVCDADGVYLHFAKMDGTGIVGLARYFSDSCADPNSDLLKLRRLGKRLHDLFIAPIAKRLGQTQVLVLDGDDDLGNVPFEAFWGDHGYLAASYRVVLAPAVLFGTDRPSNAKLSAGSHALVVGSTATAISDDLSLLPAPDVVKEARNVAERFPGADLLVASQATKARVEALLPSAEIFHYVGHAVADVKREGLLFAGSRREGQAEIWSAADVKQKWFRHCKLVVLAACSTGRGSRGRREIHGEVLRAMLRAGVPHIVATRWDVDSLTTESFMKAFYLAVSSGKSVSEAASVAVMELLGTPQTQHPYYWAAFGIYHKQ